MREIEAHDVDAGGEHSLQDGGVAAGGTERGDDLGVAGHGEFLAMVSGSRQCYAQIARAVTAVRECAR